MNILISGSSGYIGKNLKDKFKASKHNLVILEKNLSIDDIANIIKNNKVDCVINLVGMLKEKKNNTFESVHVELLKNLLEAGNKTHLKLFVQMSALGVGENIQTEYFKTKEEAEELIKSSSIPYTIIRPALIFGKGDKSISFFLKIMKTVHVMPVFGGGKYLVQPVHIDDITNLIMNVIDNTRYENRIIEIAGPKTYMFKEMLKALKKVTHTKSLLINLPMFISKDIASFGNYLKRRKNNSIIQITGVKGLEEI